MTKSDPSRNPSFLKRILQYRAPEKKKEKGLTCLRNRRFHRPSWSRTHLQNSDLAWGKI
jgi:hypothetical protein